MTGRSASTGVAAPLSAPQGSYSILSTVGDMFQGTNIDDVVRAGYRKIVSDITDLIDSGRL
jgi:hypothetical protein